MGCVRASQSWRLSTQDETWWTYWELVRWLVRHPNSEKKQMVAPSLLRGLPRLRLRLQLQSLAVAVNLLTRRPCSTSAELTRTDENLSSAVNTSVPSSKEPPSYPRIDDPDFTKWKDKKEEILKDIEPIALLVKEILHSQRYFDGETLTAEDEKIVVEKLLPYHPHSEDKIGCGLDSIMVDRHTQFRQSRCLFVLSVDGGWIDFSYRKCLRAYIRQNKFGYHLRHLDTVVETNMVKPSLILMIAIQVSTALCTSTTLLFCFYQLLGSKEKNDSREYFNMWSCISLLLVCISSFFQGAG